MTRESSNADLTLALNTTLEREFVAPLTAIRGALEIVRDFPDLASEERKRFIDNALNDCSRLERGIDQLADTVYAATEAGQRNGHEESNSEYADRIHVIDDLQVVEVDFSDFQFNSSRIVNEFYDYLDRLIENSGHHWYILVNYRNCSIWPDAWVAFAHRGQKVNSSYSLGTVRYIDSDEDGNDADLYEDPELFPSREAALARIEALRLQAQGA